MKSIQKIQTLIEAKGTLSKWRSQGENAVFTNGCFDLIHVGHVRYLQQARELGDHLVIGLNSDESVHELKGPSRPILPEEERAELLAALSCVDLVVMFSEKRVTNLLKVLQPEIYAKGGDYTPETLDPGERSAIESYGGKIVILPVVPGRSTSWIITKIKETC